MDGIPWAGKSPNPSPKVLRDRRYRRRKQDGLKSVRVLLGAAEVDMLIARQFLEPTDRDDSLAIGDAVEIFIHDASVISSRHA
jgi:hypothetical protein